MRIIHVPFGNDWRAEVVTEETPVTIHTQRKEGKRIVYETSGYVALATRPATEQEVNAWRNQ